MSDPYGFNCKRARDEERRRRREEQASLARRGFDRGPSVPAGPRWTTHLPARPPGVR